MEVFLIRVLQFILAISLLVLLHEGGHFFFAKLFGVRVEKFYIFFDWKFSLFKFKPKHSDTEYGIGWLPLGGYCKIAGMIDESFDTEQMKQPVQDYEFRAKPAWQRLLIMIGGVLVNFLLALFIYSQILFWWGDTYIPVKDMTMGMKFNQEAKSYGFQDGDILLGTEKKTFKDFSADLYRDISEAKRVDIIRNGKHMSISLPGDLNLLGMLKADPSFVRPLLPAKVDSIVPGTPAEKIGMQKGDHILAVNGTPVDSYNEFIDQLGRRQDLLLTSKTQADSLKARTITLVYGNEARTDTTSVTLTPDLKLGFVVQSIAGLYSRRHQVWLARAGLLRRRHEICIHGRRCQVAGRLRSYWLAVPAHVGLVHVLEDDSIPQHHSGLHEHSAHSCLRRWPRAVPALRDDTPPQTLREFHDQGRIRGIRHPDIAHGYGQPQRHPALAGVYVAYI